MKIIQLLAAIDGESPGTIGSQIYGLGDDGAVYELVSPRQPYTKTTGGAYGPRIHVNGVTGGWQSVCRSDEFSQIVLHPEQ